MQRHQLILVFSMFIVWAVGMVNSVAAAGEVGPSRVIAALKSQLSEHYSFIVSFKPGHTSEAMLKDAADAVDLPLFNSKAVTLKVADAFALAEQADIDWVWYLPPAKAPITIRALQGLDYVVNTLDSPNLINLSLGPPSSFYPREPEPKSPFSRAVAAAAARGFIVIAAVGNIGTKWPGYVNPWSIPKEVIAVGAWDHNTGTIWKDSSTAVPEQIESWPDVVAPGVDVISFWTTAHKKPNDRKAHDEANERFRKQVPKKDWDNYTMMSGTSQAAAIVSRASAQVLRYLKGFIAENNPGPGELLFSLEADADRISDFDTQMPRLTGKAIPTQHGGMIYEYWLDEPWRLVKQILIDTAIPVTGARPWEGGAGLVDPDYIRKQFGAYGVEPPQPLPVKVKK